MIKEPHAEINNVSLYSKKLKLITIFYYSILLIQLILIPLIVGLAVRMILQERGMPVLGWEEIASFVVNPFLFLFLLFINAPFIIFVILTKKMLTNDLKTNKPVFYAHVSGTVGGSLITMIAAIWFFAHFWWRVDADTQLVAFFIGPPLFTISASVGFSAGFLLFKLMRKTIGKKQEIDDKTA